MTIRTRIAPSPTGAFHIGNAQSALYNWFFARKNKGDFYVRIEDTDKARSTKDSEEGIKEALNWLGLMPDSGFIRQSDNLPRHKELLQKLLQEGKAFYCHHSQEDLEAERKLQEEKKEAPRHFCEHKNSEKRRTPGGIIRLLTDENSDRIISFSDQVRGHVQFKENLLGDFSIARAVDDPLYNFAAVADDNVMGITHVVRGEDHLSNTPKQILIYEALDFTIPVFAHLPLILGPDRSKLSKRHGGTATLDYKKDYLPEALLNFLGGLSYTFSKEILTREEMIQEFELEKIHKSGAIFDIKKLNWINSQYIRSAQVDKLSSMQVFKNVPKKALPLVTERLEKLSDVKNFSYFWEEPSFAPPSSKTSEGQSKASEGRPESIPVELLKWKKSTLEKSLEVLAEVKKIIEEFDFENGKDELRKLLDDLAKKVEVGDPVKSPGGDHGASRGLVYWPLRVALTGKEKSPDPVDIVFVLGKQKTLERVGKAVK